MHVARHYALRHGRRWSPLLACVLFAVALPGCPMTSWLRQDADFGPPLPTGVGKDELVNRLNENIARLFAWRSTDVQIQARSGLPLKLSANLAVESPRNFRLRVSSVAGDEADFGSNGERFWFWMRRSDPNRVFTARHDQLDEVQRRVPIPFQPDWLMEVLGVIPIEASLYTLEHSDPEGRTVTLVSERLTPSGQPVRRVILVDARHGLVLGHSLYDATGKLIAKAALKDHQLDAVSQVILPHRIDLDWPNAGLAMTMHIGKNVEINPHGLPEAMWQPSPGLQLFDLAAGR